MGKIIQKRILDVKLKVPQKREGELCGGVLKKGVKTRYIITNTSYIISNTSISSNNSSQKKTCKLQQYKSILGVPEKELQLGQHLFCCISLLVLLNANTTNEYDFVQNTLADYIYPLSSS